MKIKLKKKEKDIKIISDGKYSFEVDFNKVKSSGDFHPIICVKDKGKDKKYVYTCVIDSKGNIIVPIREKLITDKELEDLNFETDIIVFPNNKAIYTHENHTYIIDLNEVYFDGLMPLDYVLELTSAYITGTDTIIAYLNDKAFLYNVVNTEMESIVFDFIKPVEDDVNKFIGHIFFENKYVEPSMFTIEISKGYNMSKEIFINNELIALTDNNKTRSELIEYVDNCYNDYLENQEGDLGCKVLM